MQPRTVLIVEDNPATRKVFRLAFEGDGFRVFEAQDEASALATIPCARPDLLVLDQVLPRIGGLDLLAELRREAGAPDLPALLVSGGGERGEAPRALADPAVRVLARPVEPARLVAAANAQLGRDPAGHGATSIFETPPPDDSLALLREMTDNLREVVWVRSADRKHVFYVNEAYARVFGRSTESLRRNVDSWLDVVHPDDRPRLEAALEGAGTGPLEVTYRILRPDGGVRWIRGRLIPTLDADGEVTHYAGVAEDITPAKEAEDRLVAARNELEALSRRLVHVQEEERRMLARELHDEFGQMLTSLKLNLEAEQREGRPPDLAELAAQVGDLLARVRNLSLDLRPPMLDELGLVPALVWHFDRFEQQTGIHVEFQQTGMDPRCSPGTEITAFRIIQEALTNVARHADTRLARVRLHATDGRIELEIADEGRGFEPARPGGSATGLTGMRERALLVGGKLRVESIPGRGTRIRASLPRRRAETSPRSAESS